MSINLRKLWRKYGKKKSKGVISSADIQSLFKDMAKHAVPLPESEMVVEFVYEGKRYRGVIPCVGEAE